MLMDLGRIIGPGPGLGRSLRRRAGVEAEHAATGVIARAIAAVTLRTGLLAAFRFQAEDHAIMPRRVVTADRVVHHAILIASERAVVFVILEKDAHELVLKRQRAQAAVLGETLELLIGALHPAG